MRKKYKDGICPCCGSKVYYNEDTSAMNFLCFDCGATGNVKYKVVFDGYSDICDGDGNPVGVKE